MEIKQLIIPIGLSCLFLALSSRTTESEFKVETKIVEKVVEKTIYVQSNKQECQVVVEEKPDGTKTTSISAKNDNFILQDQLKTVDKEIKTTTAVNNSAFAFRKYSLGIYIDPLDLEKLLNNHYDITYGIGLGIKPINMVPLELKVQIWNNLDVRIGIEFEF